MRRNGPAGGVGAVRGPGGRAGGWPIERAGVDCPGHRGRRRRGTGRRGPGAPAAPQPRTAAAASATGGQRRLDLAHRWAGSADRTGGAASRRAAARPGRAARASALATARHPGRRTPGTRGGAGGAPAVWGGTAAGRRPRAAAGRRADSAGRLRRHRHRRRGTAAAGRRGRSGAGRAHAPARAHRARARQFCVLRLARPARTAARGRRLRQHPAGGLRRRAATAR